jgi:hypothetical protein
MGMQTRRTPIPPAAERRIRREARSAAFRERALALHEAGWTLINIGQVLGVSTTRAFQIVRKAKRLHLLITRNERGRPVARAPWSNSPLQTGRNKGQRSWLYPLPPT